MMKISFYCTEELHKKLKEIYGDDKGRAGRLSANIERMLWDCIKKEIPPAPPKEKAV